METFLERKITVWRKWVKEEKRIMEAAVKINHWPPDKFASLTATSRAAMIQPRRRIITMRSIILMNMRRMMVNSSFGKSTQQG